jgi:phosphatidylserine/phosphatidylglycerophosphate/cardiolipin synthase-like enzyme
LEGPVGMRRTLPAAGLLSAGLLFSSLVAPQAAQGAPEEEPFVPAAGVTFNSPTTRRDASAILRHVLDSVRATEPGEQIRVATWNFDDKPSADALIEAAQRGVSVQVVVSDRVANGNWTALTEALNGDDRDDTFAMKCRGGCRSRSPIMHTKLYMFSRVGTASHITMFGSSNLTDPARFRQWNDLITTGSSKVYDFLAPIYDQYTRDRAVENPFQVETLGDYRVWVYPVGDRNPQASQLRKVRCHGATGGTGTPDGRTRIRVAVAGWFDAYGQQIADELRRLWDRGCDVKVVTTLAGRGVNQTLKARTGRGPVPIRQLSFDNNGDGVPDRYLHQKSMAVSGVFGSDTSASVVMTGSPNWSSRASRSEELWVRVLDHPGMTRRYLDRVDNLYRSRFSSPRLSTRADLRQALAMHARVTGQAHPDWLELD